MVGHYNDDDLTHVSNGVEEGKVGSPHPGITNSVEEAAHGREHERGGEGGQQAAHGQGQEGFGVGQERGGSRGEIIHLRRRRPTLSAAQMIEEHDRIIRIAQAFSLVGCFALGVTKDIKWYMSVRRKITSHLGLAIPGMMFYCKTDYMNGARQPCE